MIDPESFKQICESHPDFWAHWGFEPWRTDDLVGVRRDQRFIKSGLLGPVADYNAVEFIVWETGDELVRERLWQTIGPLPEVITQRFLFVLPTPWTERKIRSFRLGFRGYLEFYAYWPGSGAHKKAADLTGLVDLVLKLNTPPVD